MFLCHIGDCLSLAQYPYVSFSAYRGRMDNPLFHISTTTDTNRAEDYQKKVVVKMFIHLECYYVWVQDEMRIH